MNVTLKHPEMPWPTLLEASNKMPLTHFTTRQGTGRASGQSFWSKPLVKASGQSRGLAVMRIRLLFVLMTPHCWSAQYSTEEWSRFSYARPYLLPPAIHFVSHAAMLPACLPVPIPCLSPPPCLPVPIPCLSPPPCLL